MADRIYFYKCVVDDGKAPCVDRNRLSLAICKPQIRRTASVGDFLIAFGSNADTPPNRLVYAARITAQLTDGKYFDDPAFQKRQDCIYERTPRGLLRLKRDSKVHHLPHFKLRDVGSAPDYPNAIVLVSNDFRYFGDQGTDVWKTAAPRLAKRIEQLGQGHRVNHSREIRDELLRLISQLWHTFPRKVNGTPLHRSDDGCAREEKCNASIKSCP